MTHRHAIAYEISLGASVCLFVCLFLPDVVGEVASHSKYGKILLELKTRIYNEIFEVF